jgi:hypothetical protein
MVAHDLLIPTCRLTCPLTEKGKQNLRAYAKAEFQIAIDNPASGISNRQCWKLADAASVGRAKQEETREECVIFAIGWRPWQVPREPERLDGITGTPG